MRLIDADALKKELGDTNMDIYTNEVKEMIDQQPTIEQKPIAQKTHIGNWDMLCQTMTAESFVQIAITQDLETILHIGDISRIAEQRWMRRRKMINSREEMVDKIKKAKHFKGKSLALHLVKSGMLDSLIGKTDEELADMLLKFIQNGGKYE